jgi:seryl-tRNA synthetase
VLDVRRIRAEPDTVKAALARRDPSLADAVDEVQRIDEAHRAALAELEANRARSNELSKQRGRPDEATIAESKALRAAVKEIEARVEDLADQVRDALLRIPNTPSDDAPDGTSERDNVVLRTHGDASAFGDHQRVPHWDIGVELGIIDTERAVKISGAMFVLYRGWGARLLRALVQLSLDRNADAYEEIRPPSLVKTETMISTGHLPKFEDDAYHVERDDLWAIPTAEVPLTSLHRDEILDEATLPLRYTAYSTCYRREAGSAGRDTRGLLRAHEFDKVELLAIARDAEQAVACQEDVLARSESILRDLGLTYRLVDLCTGDLGASAARTWDLEAYAPGCDQWLEVSSVSWFSDYQARRASIRWRAAGAKGTEVCHTVNGSAMGWPRTVAAYLETHRRADGTIAVVDALQPYLGGATVIGRPTRPGAVAGPISR